MFHFLLNALLINLSVLAAIFPHAQPARQDSDPFGDQIAQIIASLSSEERVGQLMLVTFNGSALEPDIAQLITDYNIGGVVLLAENDNIKGGPDTPAHVKSLAAELQQSAYETAQERPFVPLFISTTHRGNGQTGTQIALGTTPLPSQMALGATWNPEFARQTGEITGSELSAMGINMLLGPALDVAQQMVNLGVDTFGGDPFWVGEMGRAYITGVHQGSEERIAVIAENFPGLGFADTQPDQEIPVVPRSVDELRRFDLVPYIAVTGGAMGSLARADGIQCANIRYQGENIRSTTRPVCVDEQAAGQLLGLDEFRIWREQGLMISSPLGSPAVRRYYNISPFPHRQIAREAFLAGNDLLFLDSFGPLPGDDQFANVIDVIQFFAERYDKDVVFRAQVDRSLNRILRLKLSLYEGDLSLENVLSSPSDINSVGGANTPLYHIAQRSTTLIAPRRQSLIAPPGRDENIVIFTDLRLAQQCSQCTAYPLVSVKALESAIERIYGPHAGAQIMPEQVTSFSFVQLASYLRGGLEEQDQETNRRLDEAFNSATWIVFVMLDTPFDLTTINTLRYFLSAEPRLNDTTHIIAVALGTPTYLSATEISKFTAYYGLYSSIPAYIDAAARAIFQESTFSGALPVSLPATGYDLFTATSPDPDQTIQIVPESLTDTQLLPSTEILTMNAGERLVLRTEPILDRNGHRVPDGTPVEFTLIFVTDNLQTRQNSHTTDGIAHMTFTPNRAGRVQITATSVDARRALTFQMMITESEVESSQSPAEQLTPALSNGPNSGQPPEKLPETAPSSRTAAPLDQQRLELDDFVLSLFGLLLVGALGFSAGMSSTLTIDGGIRVVLGSLIAGLIGYIYYGIDGPGVQRISSALDDFAPIITALLSGLAGMLVTWWTIRRR